MTAKKRRPFNLIVRFITMKKPLVEIIDTSNDKLLSAKIFIAGVSMVFLCYVITFFTFPPIMVGKAGLFIYILFFISLILLFCGSIIAIFGFFMIIRQWLRRKNSNISQ